MYHDNEIFITLSKLLRQNPNLNEFMLVTDMEKDKHPEDPNWPKFFILGGMIYSKNNIPSVDNIYLDLYSTLFQFEDYEEIINSEIERIEIDNQRVELYLKITNNEAHD